VGTAIGSFSTTDPDAGDTFTYSLVAGPGSGDNASFTIAGSILKANAVFDFETKASYSIRVRTTDAGGLGFEKVFAISVTNVNETPVAVNDSAVTSKGNSVIIDVLANDSDPDGDPLTIIAVTPPSKGTATINSGTVTYTPKANYTGPDSFTYTISDGKGLTAIATVSISVITGNAPPRAVRDNVVTLADTPVIIPVLANDSDPDGDPLTVVAVTQGANGTAVINADGTVTYTPSPGFTGHDSFTYTISDGKGGTDVGTVGVRVSKK
jgi:large repetitive protein